MKKSGSNGTELFEFIKKNSGSDPRALSLALHDKDLGFPLPLAITQIECRRKCIRKLAEFLKCERFLFPDTQVAEQATHQCVAAYHAMLTGSGHRIIDMTAGLGIDAMTLARCGNAVTAIEMESDRVAALRHNTKELAVPDIEVIWDDSIGWLKKHPDLRFDILFVDPARRDSADRRTFLFRDCRPDIVTEIDMLRRCARRIMVKASPILDIERMVSELPGMTEVHVVCVNGECKEVLGVIDTENPCDDYMIHAVDLHDKPDASVSVISEWRMARGQAGAGAPPAGTDDMAPGYWLYDPNAAIHKLNCQRELCRRFDGLRRVSPNTDLYVSRTRQPGFPGREFRIVRNIDRREAKRLGGERREVMTRNYVTGADELRRRLKVISGGNLYITGCRWGDKAVPTLLECRKT